MALRAAGEVRTEAEEDHPEEAPEEEDTGQEEECVGLHRPDGMAMDVADVRQMVLQCKVRQWVVGLLLLRTTTTSTTRDHPLSKHRMATGARRRLAQCLQWR